jgi:hypothetical protein
MRVLMIGSHATFPRSSLAFAGQATLVLVAVLLAALLLCAIEVRFGVSPADMTHITAM